MHILQCLTHSGVGGAQQVVYTLAKTLLRLYPDLTHSVILPSHGEYGERFQKLGVHVIEFPTDKLSPRGLQSFSKVIEAHRPDVLHSHGKGAGFYARARCRANDQIRFYHTFHGFHLPSDYLKRRLYVGLESFLSRKTNALIAVSESEREEVVQSLSADSEKVRLISNVVDRAEVLEMGKKDELDKEFKKFLLENAGAFLIALIGRDDPIKNHALAFEAFRMLRTSGVNASMIVVGVSFSNERMMELQTLFPGKIFALTSTENSAAIISRSHVLLLSSRKEGSPLVVLEAFCLGKPVIGTNVAGIRDLVIHRQNGLLCEQNAHSLSQALAEVATMSPLYNVLSANALTSSEAMDISVWAEQYYQLYSGR